MIYLGYTTIESHIYYWYLKVKQVKKFKDVIFYEEMNDLETKILMSDKSDLFVVYLSHITQNILLLSHQLTFMPMILYSFLCMKYL